MNEISIYVDGSWNKADRRSGWAFAAFAANGELLAQKSGNHVERNAEDFWNIAGECTAAMHALWWAKHNAGERPVKIIYDYEGLEKWVTGEWKAKNWFTQEYVRRARRFSAKINITWEWVRGHTGNPGNELVDRLAREAAFGPADPPDLVLQS